MRVALLARAWIEMVITLTNDTDPNVALLARAWIEMYNNKNVDGSGLRRSPCESVD